MKSAYERWILPIATLAVVVPVACMTRWSAAVRVPRQGWWEERGPVVPHDGFPADCTLCHQGEDWHTIRDDFEFDHLAETGVPLNGAHAVAECLRCHNDRGPVELFAQRGCAGCHEDVHRGQMGADCTSCHGESSWRPEGQIALHAATRLPLAGAHAALQCWACHEGAEVGNFRNADPQCISCHLEDYQGTTNPDHVASGYATTCQDCHGFVAFDQAAIFDHAGITSNCVECHLPNYQATTDPNHTQEQFPTSCEDCHTSFRSWRGAAFNHLGITGNCAECHLPDYQGARDPDHVAQSFPTTCEDCHSSFSTWHGASFSHTGITSNCVACHNSDFNGAQDPNHVALQFPTSCEDCHSSFTTWQGANFSHAGITASCVTCHLSDYQGAQDPNHVAQNFSTDCQNCHSSFTTWNGASFSHVGITTNCRNCHLPDYQSSQDPAHAAAGFSQACETCHNSTTTWQGARYSAHHFPIYSGAHRNFDCTQCHLQNSNYNVFSCTHCHTHSQSSMNSHHSGVNGYQWESNHCYDCHPNGRS